MSYTATQLVTNSYYLSGVLSRGLQSITADQLNDGLQMLNSWIAVKTANERLIPYFTEYEFTGVIGQEKYPIENLVSAETFTFYIGEVRYSTMQQKRVTYFGSGRIDNIQSLPFSWHVERRLGGADLYIYFEPNLAYPMKIWGKFSLSSVTNLTQDLELILDRYYIEYLRFGLTEQICTEYNVPMLPQSEKRLRELEKIVTDVSPPDLQMQKISSLGKDLGYLYADVNLGHGWRP